MFPKQKKKNNKKIFEIKNTRLKRTMYAFSCSMRDLSGHPVSPPVEKTLTRC